MANKTNNTKSAQKTTENGLIASIFIRLSQIVVFFVLTLVFSIVIEWIGMATNYWGEPGIQHSEKMLVQELIYLNDDFKRSAIVRKPVQFAAQFANRFYEISFKMTGVTTAVKWLSKSSPYSRKNTKTIRKRLHRIYLTIEDYVLAAMVVTKIFAVRLAVLMLAFPVSILLALVGLVDGLVQRDIRRWSGGRESSFVYHWAKKSLYPFLILPWILYLAMPESVHPNFIVLPFAVCFAISVTIMSATFKKYL